eukprot:COSAG01_NODE_5280_length_4359_cov_2.299296_2_plen_89_part_00
MTPPPRLLGQLAALPAAAAAATAATAAASSPLRPASGGNPITDALYLPYLYRPNALGQRGRQLSQLLRMLVPHHGTVHQPDKYVVMPG